VKGGGFCVNIFASTRVLIIQIPFYFIQNLINGRLVCRGYFLFSNMFMVWVCDYVGVVRGVVIAKNTLPFSYIRICINNTHGIAKLCANGFMDI